MNASRQRAWLVAALGMACTVGLSACGADKPADLESATKFTVAKAPRASDDAENSADNPDSSQAIEAPQPTNPLAADGRNSQVAQRSSDGWYLPDGCHSIPNPLHSVNSLPVINVGTPFYFNITSDHFDPCARLSYNVIEGKSSDGRSGQGVVFFRNSSPVSIPQPLIENEIIGVTMLGDSSARVDYQILHNGRRSQGYAVFQIAGPDLDIPDRNLGDDANAAGFQVDVSGL